MLNKELAEELYWKIIKQNEKRKVHSSLSDNIWGVDLSDKQLISNFDKGFRFYYAILIFLVNTHGSFL